MTSTVSIGYFAKAIIMKELFLGFLAKTLNKPADEIAKLIYQKGDNDELTDELVENAGELLAGLDAERVTRLRTTADNKQALESQYKRGKKEALEALESALREQYKVDSDKTGADLIADIVAATAKSDLPEEKVKRHPLYLQLEKAKIDEVKALKEQAEAERAKIESEFGRKFTLAEIRQRAISDLDKLNPILPESPEIAANYKSLYAQAFEQYDYQRQEDGTFLVLKGEQRLEDAHGNPVTLDQLQRQTAAKFFQFKQQDAKGGAANKNGTAGGNQPGNVPGNEAELWDAYNKAGTKEEKDAIVEAFEKANGVISV